MKPTTTILIGAPVVGDEARVLRSLNADLQGVESLILANFDTPKRQIDFVVITPSCATLLELKNFHLPIFGGQNGIWMYETSAGERRPCSAENPWQQTKAAKFALSDEMAKYQKRGQNIPSPSGRGYFVQFGAFVCIYPEIHARSQVTRGDHKVGVASYKDTVERIKSTANSSTWNLTHWYRFAKEHLNLAEVTLAEATNPLVSAASGRIAEYLHRLQTGLGTALPALFSGVENPNCGEDLVNSMLERNNFLLLGQSGSTKTFHLHHLALAISFREAELPLILEARKYRGADFWSLLRHATAPLFRGDPQQLLDDMALCGLRPVLMLDALNDCASANLPDLLKALQAFSLQFDARIVLTSQFNVELPGNIAPLVKQMPALNIIQKRTIYAHHAGLSASSQLDYLCAGFTNAYDLTIAGRCHATATEPESRTALYDRYVRQNLSHCSAVASALLRAVAREMAQAFRVFLARDAFERFAEDFLTAQKASFTVLDEIRSSRLICLTDDSFSFEHELLFDYFSAEALRREFVDAESLSRELRKPRNQDLLEIVLPRYSTDREIELILSAACEATVLCRILCGECGHSPQSLLLRQCESLMDKALQDLSTVEIVCETMEDADGRNRFLTLHLNNNQDWTGFDYLLCNVIAFNLGHRQLQQKFLELLDLTEWTLRSAAQQAAERARFKPARVWEEAVRIFGGLLQSGRMQLPCVTILSTLRASHMFPRYYIEGLPIRAQLFDRIAQTPERHLSMLMLFEDLQHGDLPGDIDINAALAQKGLETNVYILRVSALELLQSMARYVDEISPDKLAIIRRILEDHKTVHIFENTIWLEALTSYGGLDLPVSLNDAQLEMKSLITPGSASSPDLLELAQSSGVSPEQIRAQNAYGCLTRIFEDVFQGVYYEAYSQLSHKERHDILRLAASAEQRGFSTDWIVCELLRHGENDDLSIFQKLASRPDADMVCPQESVATFVLGLVGCARFGEMPPPYLGGDSQVHLAWNTVGEMMFWLLRTKATGCGDSGRTEALWGRLRGEAALATADVLYQMVHSRLFVSNLEIPDLLLAFPGKLRPILEQCLLNRELLPTVFTYGGSRDRSVIKFLINALGRVGSDASIAVLEGMVDESECGRDAIHAIEQLRKI